MPKLSDRSNTKSPGAPRRFALLAVSMLLVLAVPPATTDLARGTSHASEPDPDRPLIELALCLDTSGSMKPSIDAARTHLWGIVDDLSRLETTPRLRVALLTYGNTGNPRDSGWIRIDSPLTEDLDSVSRALFELETGGAQEYVERVIRVALDQLDWSPAENVLRMILVMGNEEADQDQTIEARDLAFDADDREVAVHPIYVGTAVGQDFETWRLLGETLGVQVATLQPGKRPKGAASPYDEELAALGRRLSTTYVPFGEDGAEAAENQKLQDENVESLGVAVAASRAITKAGPLYQGDWDLVDAIDSGRVSLDDVPDEDLPPNMRSMTFVERENYLMELTEQRRELREKIRALGARREQHLEESGAAGVKKRGDDLRNLIRRTIRERAAERGLEF